MIACDGSVFTSATLAASRVHVERRADLARSDDCGVSVVRSSCSLLRRVRERAQLVECRHRPDDARSQLERAVSPYARIARERVLDLRVSEDGERRLRAMQRLA